MDKISLERDHAQVRMPKIALDRTEIRWGNIECLKDSSNSIKLANVGLTTASLHMYLKTTRNHYRLAVPELVLEAGQSFNLEVTANLDDCVVSKGELHVLVKEGADHLVVPLLANGIGVTLLCKQKVDVMDLGVQLTNNYLEKQIVLENKGHRSQQLEWTNQAPQPQIPKDVVLLESGSNYYNSLKKLEEIICDMSSDDEVLQYFDSVELYYCERSIQATENAKVNQIIFFSF